MAKNRYKELGNIIDELHGVTKPELKTKLEEINAKIREEDEAHQKKLQEHISAMEDLRGAIAEL